MLGQMTREQGDALLARMREPGFAQLLASEGGQPINVWVQTFDLSTARSRTNALKVARPFSSWTILSATDSNANFNFRPDTDADFNEPGNFKSPAKFSVNPLIMRAGYFHWDAQAGKTITLIFCLFGEISTNQTNLAISGGVNISRGTTPELAPITFVANTAKEILASDLDRNLGEFRNTTGSTIWLGVDSTVTVGAGANPGIPLYDGESYPWESKGALWGIVDVAATIGVLAHY